MIVAVLNSRVWKYAHRSSQFLLLSIIAGCSGTASYTQDRKIDSHAELAISDATTNRVIAAGQMLQSLRLAEATVNDPVYAGIKHYEGFWLEDVLRLAEVRFGADKILAFTCLDGYQARLAHGMGTNARPLIAVRDLDSADSWEPFMHGKEKTTPAPFYLVWKISGRLSDVTNNSGASLPWPYQINRIDVRSSAEARSRLLPVGAESREDVQRGFDLFARSCIACHSINLEGGALGPELSIPRNITEYRDWHYLADFIKDPSSFRARSKMPGFKSSLTDQQIDDVLQYLSWMRERKAALR